MIRVEREERRGRKNEERGRTNNACTLREGNKKKVKNRTEDEARKGSEEGTHRLARYGINSWDGSTILSRGSSVGASPARPKITLGIDAFESSLLSNGARGVSRDSA